ncbi:uncharacterized protein [Diadema setosum]|uniref:uncharacterized protein n=1 Tax=Diadema setosum TaxID=31175 RepID=UPI003B3B7C74
MASFANIQVLLSLLGIYLRSALSQEYTYLGCFYDDFQRDVLPDLIFCDRSRHPYNTCQNVCNPVLGSNYCQSGSMTIELCRDMCLDQNLRYFGLQAGTQCLCGGDFAQYDRLGRPTDMPTEACRTPCVGNSSTFCGGEFQMSVFEFMAPQSHCYNPGYVLNGGESQAGDLYDVNDTIEFASLCPPPSIKNGPASITCTTSGNWTDSPPVCTVRCSTPTVPAHANFSSGQTLTATYSVDDMVLFDCDLDPTKTNQILTCDFFGNWITDVECPDRSPTTVGLSTTSRSSMTPSSLQSTTSAGSTDLTTGSLTTASGATTNATDAAISSQAATTQSGATSSPAPTSSPGPTSSPEPTSSSSPTVAGSSTLTFAATTDDGRTPEASTRPQRTTREADMTTRSQGPNDLGLLPIIVGAAAAVLVVIVVVIIISVCCSRQRKRQTKKIPFDPALGTSFGNPAFEDDEQEESRRGFVQENDYGDLPRQTYDIGNSDYATVDEVSSRAPPDGKDSPGTAPIVEGGIDKNRNGSVTSFKPDASSGSYRPGTLPTQNSSRDTSDLYAVPNKHRSQTPMEGPDEYFKDPANQIATPL